MRAFIVGVVLGIVLGCAVLLLVINVTDVWYEYQTAPVINTSSTTQLLAQGWQIDRLYGPNNLLAVLRRPRLNSFDNSLAIDLVLVGASFCAGVAAAGIVATLVLRRTSATIAHDQGQIQT